jgi:hypothetical protein
MSKNQITHVFNAAFNSTPTRRRTGRESFAATHVIWRQVAHTAQEKPPLWQNEGMETKRMPTTRRLWTHLNG